MSAVARLIALIRGIEREFQLKRAARELGVVAKEGGDRLCIYIGGIEIAFDPEDLERPTAELVRELREIHDAALEAIRQRGHQIGANP